MLVACSLAVTELPASAAESVTNSIGMRLVPIEPGTFTMGQDGPPLEDYLRQKRFGEMYKATNQIDFDEKPAHQVTISRPFLMGVTEVTVGQYRKCDPGFKTDDPKAKPADDDAATNVTWDQAAAFCEWLSKKEGKPYRLPTEAEWEYACRAGTTTRWWWGDEEEKVRRHAWYGNNADGPQPVDADHHRNAWGLADMAGNVWEWCNDWYDAYDENKVDNPTGPAVGDCRVLRGGSWGDDPLYLRSAYRYWFVPSYSGDYFGFRCVRVLRPEPSTL